MPEVEPTDEQIQWLWEQCGWSAPYIKDGTWKIKDEYGIHQQLDMPDIDLNNLFKYEPLTARGYHITTDTYKREVAGTMGQCSWAKIIDPNGNIVSCFAMKELKDALFWAIFTALGGK